MRTTLTLEEDLFVRLKQRAHERGLPFKQVVNDAIRDGLQDRGGRREPYRMTRTGLQLRDTANIDRALELAGADEDAELLRKLEQGR